MEQTKNCKCDTNFNFMYFGGIDQDNQLALFIHNVYHLSDNQSDDLFVDVIRTQAKTLFDCNKLKDKGYDYDKLINQKKGESVKLK